MTQDVQDVNLWAVFTTKATGLGATVHRVRSEMEAAPLLAKWEGPGSATTHGLAEQFPHLAHHLRGAAALSDGKGGTSAEERPVAAEVVAAGRFAVAETGSVALCESNADRGACYLAERLWLVVPSDTVVPTLDAALERLATLVHGGARYVTLMSGPSRTADIERTLTIGVHGPRQLVIIVVETEVPTT